jgi:hypothetical protein
MNRDTIDALATLGAAAIFVLIFYGESWWRLRVNPETTRRIVSFSTGMAVAYVFVHLLPELAAATSELVEISEERGLPFADLMVYSAALLGFMLFYGLENMVSWSRLTHAEGGQEHARKRIRLRVLTGSYALYVFVVCYVMAHEMRAGGGQLALYALAMGLHFLGFAYALRRDSDTAYRQRGRHVLAAAALLGWAVALLLPVPEAFAYTLLGFVAGVLIMDTVTSELAGEAEGRFSAFLAGGAVYTVVLLLIAR